MSRRKRITPTIIHVNMVTMRVNNSLGSGRYFILMRTVHSRELAAEVIQAMRRLQVVAHTSLPIVFNAQ